MPSVTKITRKVRNSLKKDLAEAPEKPYIMSKIKWNSEFLLRKMWILLM